MIVAMSAPRRPCYGCEIWDDHPRHEIVGEPESSMHMDCCVEHRGCKICATQIQRAMSEAGVSHGTALGQVLAMLPPVTVEHVPNDNDGDPHNLTTAVVTGI